MTRLAGFVELEKITQRLRLTPLESDQERVYAELLNFTDSSGTCDCAINAHALFGPQGVVEVLKTLEHLSRARKEFASSNHLKQCLEMLSSSEIVQAQSIALGILLSTEVESQQQTQHSGLQLHNYVIPDSAIFDVVSFAAPLVSHESLGLSERSCRLIETLLHRVDQQIGVHNISSYEHENGSTSAVDALLRPLLKAMNACSSADGTLQFRYCTVFARALRHSERIFRSALVTGVVESIVRLVRTPDVLMQMTALELLVSFAGTVSGMRYLLAEGLLTWLVGLAGGFEATNGMTADPYLGPEAVRCTAEILPLVASSSAFTVLSAAPTTADLTDSSRDDQRALLEGFLRAMLLNIDSTADGSRYASLDAIATFATSSATALCWTLEHVELVRSWLLLLRSPKPELRGAVLLCIAHVVSSPIPVQAARHSLHESALQDKGPETEAVAAARRKLCVAVGQPHNLPTVRYLVNSARQPVSESRRGACRMLAAMAKHAWGLQLLFADASDGFYPYLQDYHGEHGQQQKEWKFEVVAAVAASPGLLHLRNDVQAFVALRLAQGPYFMPAELAEPMVI